MFINIIHNHKSGRKPINELFGYDLIFWPAIYCGSKKQGISRAHKQIVRYAKENNLPEIFICEDDIKLVRPLNEFISKKPKEFDLYIGGVSSFNKKNYFTGMHCYIIRQNFYDVFLSADETQHIDFWLGGRGNYVICSPPVAHQHLKINWEKVDKKVIDHYQ